jgi:hypothetical protein
MIIMSTVGSELTSYRRCQKDRVAAGNLTPTILSLRQTIFGLPMRIRSYPDGKSVCWGYSGAPRVFS